MNDGVIVDRQRALSAWLSHAGCRMVLAMWLCMAGWLGGGLQAASVQGVTTSTVSGTYGAGVVIDITVTFTGSVTVTNVPTLNLTGGLSASYFSGSNSASLVFRMTTGASADSGGLLDVLTNPIVYANGSVKIEDFGTSTNSTVAFTPSGATSLLTTKSITIETTRPTVVSSNRVEASPSSLATVTFTVTFDEAVTGVGASDFALNTTGVVGASITGVTASSTSVYVVSVAVGTGSGTIEVKVNASGTGIADLAGNTLNGGFTAGEVYAIVDNTAPTVWSSVRMATSPTNTGSVHFLVTFSEPVIGLALTPFGDFTLDTTGFTVAPLVTAVTASGATAYDVTVSTGSGYGTIQLRVATAATGITDAAGNALFVPAGGFITGQTYIIDKTAPTVQSSLLMDSSPSSQAAVDFLVIFSETVSGVDSTDFTVVAAGVTGTTPAVTNVAASGGSSYVVTVSTGSGSGTIQLQVKGSGTGIADDAGNPLTGGAFTTGQTYALDRTDPTVVSSLRASASPSALGAVDFVVTFSEPVSGVDGTDFTVVAAGVTGTTPAVTNVAASGGSSYVVTVSTGSGSGTIQLQVKGSGTAIVDGLGNPLTGGAFTTGQTYAIDRTAPTVSSIARLDPDPTSLSSVRFLVAFSEPVSGIDGTAGASNNTFDLVTTNLSSVAISSVSPASGTNATYTVTVSTGTPTSSSDGSIQLRVKANAQGQDAVGNALVAAFTSGPTYTVNLRPAVYLGGGTTQNYTSPSYSVSSTQQALPGSLVINSPGGNLQKAVVTLGNTANGASEFLNYNASGFPTAQITVVAYDSITGILELDAVGGAQSASVFESALKLVLYQNDSSSLSAGTRSVAVTITDVNGLVSDVSTMSVNVVTGGSPQVLANGTAGSTIYSFVEGAPSPIAPALKLVNPLTPWPFAGQGGPEDLYQIFPGFGLSFLSNVTVLNTVSITITNPSGNLLSGESLTVSNPQLPWYDGVGGNGYGQILAYAGSAPYGFYALDGSYLVSGASTATLNLGPVTTANNYPLDQGYAVRPFPTQLVEDVLKTLTYVNTDSNPTRNGNTRVVTITVTNTTSQVAVKTSNTATVTITIVPVNQPPTITGPTAYALNQGDSSFPITGLIIGDVDGGNNNETLTVNVGQGTLTFTPAVTGVTATLANGNKTLTLVGSMKDNGTGKLETALLGNNIRYTPNPSFSGQDLLTVSMDDGGHTGGVVPLVTYLPNAGQPIFLNVAPVNAPPAIALPGGQSVSENTVLTMTGLRVTDPNLDPDFSVELVQVHLQASNGTLSLAQITGLNFSFGGDADQLSGGIGSDGSKNMVFRGTLSSVNGALASLTYTPDTDFYGADTIQFAVNDLGNSGLRMLPGPGGSISAGSGVASWVNARTIAVRVDFVNSVPLIPSKSDLSVVPVGTANISLTVPVNGTAVIVGGTYTMPTYPLIGSHLNNSYSPPTAAVGTPGTAVAGGSNLVAFDNETRDARGITYTVTLGVSQGTLLRLRPTSADPLDPPADPLVGTVIVDTPGFGEDDTFTQNDLNNGYVSYTQNGTLSGNDGFVFTVQDDNDASYPLPITFNDSALGLSQQSVFNITIDRTLPQVILSTTYTPVFAEPTPPALAVPVLVDSGAQVFNASDSNVPKQFSPAGNKGASITATISIPVVTQVAVHPAPAVQNGDTLDELGIQDSGSVHVGPLNVMTGITPLSYGGANFAAGTLIGSFTGGKNGVSLVIAIESTSPVLVSTVEDVIKHLTFVNYSQNPSASPRAISIQVVNGSTSASTSVAKTVGVQPYNNPPVLVTVRKILAVPNVAVPFAITRGTATDLTVASVADPDGDVTYVISPLPIKGTVAATATPGVFTYTAATPAFSASGITTDLFTITATDNGLVSNPATQSSLPLVIDVVITDTGSFAPVIDSNPPFEAVQGGVLSYTPSVVLPVTGRLALTPIRSFTLIDTGNLTTPALGFSAGTTGDGTITWAAGWSVATSTGLEAGVAYQTLGILVNDLANETAAYQKILLRIVQAPTGTN